MKYNIAVTFPLTLWLEDVEADSPEEAIKKAAKIAIDTPYEDWGDDFSTATFDIVYDD